MDIVSIQSGQNIANQNDANQQVASVSAERNAQVKEQSTSDSRRPASALFNINEILAKEAQALQQNADKSETSEEDDLPGAVEEVQAFFRAQNRNLTFAVDEDTRRSVVTVKDAESGDVIRQIPSEEVLLLAERIKAFQEDINSRVGVFVNKQV